MTSGSADGRERPGAGVLWVEAPRGTRRLPDPVRAAAVRAGLSAAVTLVAAMVAAMAALDGTWLVAPAMLLATACAVVGAWTLVDVLVTRQSWRQRAGVVSSPSSTEWAGRPGRRTAPPAGGAAPVR
jgi:hypothetical protein